MKFQLLLRYAHAALAIALAAFFIKAGIKNFNPKIKELDKAAVIQALDTKVYNSPETYLLTTNSMRSSNFIFVIGAFEILAAILICIPKTRLLGLCVLLPIIFNIFLLHVTMDNRMHENVETGILLGVTVLLMVYYKEKIALIWQRL